MNTMHKIGLASGLAAMLALSGCWLDDDDDEPVPPGSSGSIPGSASGSGTAFVSYLLTLGGSDETSEPLLVPDSLAVPPDDSGEPQAL